MTRDDELMLIREHRRHRAMQDLYEPNRPKVVVKTHGDLYGFVAETIGSEEKITVLEFGVANGQSLRGFAQRFVHPGSKFFGFDSFVGLPESWLMHDRGAFTTHGRMPDLADPRVSFVKGWFQNTVPAFLSCAAALQRPILVHFDADLYSSTLFLLSSLWHKIGEYFFIMDDFTQDDIVALQDFATAYPIELRFLAQTGLDVGNPPVPGVVFGHVSRCIFELPEDGDAGA